MNEVILVIAAHPDDEVLGCGGTIAKMAKTGAEVHIAFLADGVSARHGAVNINHQELVSRRNAAQVACDILGAKSVSFGEFPDNRMDTVALLDVVKSIEELVAKFSPNKVLTHHHGDLNIDHRRVHEASVVACRPQIGCAIKELLFFEIASSTEWSIPNQGSHFEPNWFVDISDTIEQKLVALEAYSMELRSWPHPRSIKAVNYMARLRGATIGVDAAEAFILGRKLS